MKKTMACLLGIALGWGAAAPAADAAANPFSDVPEGHWAYDAVAELAQDGVVNGYGDGTYRGERNITRYEMAQMVAKAMAKSDVSAKDKALIDKLAAEFSDELTNLGVRVAELERNADKVTWHGELRYTYTNKHRAGAKTERQELKLRMEPKAEISEHWSVVGRFDATQNPHEDNEVNLVLKRAYAQGDYKNFQVKLGRMSAQTFYDNMMMFADEFSGVEMTFGTFGKDFSTRVRVGKYNMGNLGAYATASGVGAGQVDAVADFQSLALDYQKGGFEGVAALYHFKAGAFRDNNGGAAARNYRYSRSGEEDEALVWELVGSYRFDKNWRILGAYAQNTKADYYDKAGIAQLEYKAAQPSPLNPGSWGAYLAYRHLGGNTALDTLPDGCGLNEKGWEIGAKATIAQNVQASAIYYFGGKRLDTEQHVSKFFGRLEYWF